MTFQPVLSDKLRDTLVKLSTRDKTLAIAVNKKIRQVCSCDAELIGHYKNLKYGISEFRRVHVGKSFVLLFKVDFERKLVLFTKLDHRDNVYK